MPRDGCGARGNPAGALLTVTGWQPARGSACFFLRPPQSARRGLRTAPPRAFPRTPTGRERRSPPDPGSQARGGWETGSPPSPRPGYLTSRPLDALSGMSRLRLRGGGRTACSPARTSLKLAIPHPSRRPAHPNGPADLESSKPLRTRSEGLNVRAPPSHDHAPFRQGGSRRRVLPIIHSFPRATSQQVSDWLIMRANAEEGR